jgi:hypothetical protein
MQRSLILLSLPVNQELFIPNYWVEEIQKHGKWNTGNVPTAKQFFLQRSVQLSTQCLMFICQVPEEILL